MNTLNQHTRAFSAGASIGSGGTRPADIRNLRRALDELDYLKSPARAAPNYTPIIADAIQRFQGDFGLKPDGVIAPDGPTEQALNFAVTANRTGGRDTLDPARNVFKRMGDNGFSFIRDRSDFDAMGVWRDRTGNRIAPERNGRMLDPLPARTDGFSSPAAAKLLTGVFGNKIAKDIASRSPLTSAPPGKQARLGTMQASSPTAQTNETAVAEDSPNLSRKQKSLHSRGQKPLEDLTLKDLDDSHNFMRVFRRRADKWETGSLPLAGKSLNHSLDGSGKPRWFSREEIRALPPMKGLEKEIRTHFEQREFLGMTKNNTYNATLKNLKDGKSIRHGDENNANVDLEESAQHYLGGEKDFAFSVGRTQLKGDASYEARRIGDKIHFNGTITYIWNETYDFNEGEAVSHLPLRLKREMGARPFDMRAAWQQTFSGTSTIENGVLSDPKITWTDIDSEE